jgi:hypothetical protein
MIDFVDQKDNCLYNAHIGDAAAAARILLHKIRFDQHRVAAFDDAPESSGKVHRAPDHF